MVGTNWIRKAAGLALAAVVFTGFVRQADLSVRAEGVPAKPEDNANYAETMSVTFDTALNASFEGGVIRNNDASKEAPCLFGGISLQKSDAYVYRASVTVSGNFSATETWKGPRLIFRGNDVDNYLCLALYSDSIMIMHRKDGNWSSTDFTDDEFPAVPFQRESGKTYDIALLSEDGFVTVWVDGQLMFNRVAVPQYNTQMGILFAQAACSVRDIQIYNTSKEERPSAEPVPERPEGAPNLADGMYVNTFDSGTFENGVLTATKENDAIMPFGIVVDRGTPLLYEATFRVDKEYDDVWKGPRFIFRSSTDYSQYLAVSFFKDQVVVLNIGVNWSDEIPSPQPVAFHRETGRDYKVTILSTAESLSVWLDGKQIFQNVSIPSLPADSMGVTFAQSLGEIKDIGIYAMDGSGGGTPSSPGGDLPNESVPVMPEGNVDLLPDNYSLEDYSGGTLKVSYLDGELVNLDAQSDGVFLFQSFPGLKYDDTYVLKFKLTIQEVTPNEAVGDSESMGPRIIFRAESNQAYLAFTFFKDKALLLGYHHGEYSTPVEVPFHRQLGQEYEIVIRSEPESVKIWVDNTLIIDYDGLPSYSPRVGAQIYRAAIRMKDITVFNVNPDNPEVHEAEEKSPEPILPGNTLEPGASRRPAPGNPLLIVWIAAAVIGAAGAVAVTVVLIIRRKKKQKAPLATDESESAQETDAPDESPKSLDEVSGCEENNVFSGRGDDIEEDEIPLHSDTQKY